VLKGVLPPAAAKHSLDGDIFFLLLLRKSRKKMSPSKYNLAISAMKFLFTQPQNSFPGTSRQIIFGLCEKCFAACGGEIFVG
jgi:hypothetical protein